MVWGIGNPGRWSSRGIGRPSPPPPPPPSAAQNMAVAQAQFAPALGQIGLNQQGARNQLGYNQISYGIGQNELNQQYGNAMGHLGLMQQGLGIDRAAIDRQLGYYGNLSGLSTQDYQRELGYIANLLGLNTQDYNREYGYTHTLEDLAFELLGLQNRGFDIDTVMAQQGAQVGERKARSSATARGAVNTPGLGFDLTDIANELTNRLGQIDVGRNMAGRSFRETQAGLKNKRGALGTGYQREALGLENRRGALGTGYQREQLGYAEQQAQLRDNAAQLDLRAKDMGITATEYRQRLDNGLARLNLQNVMTVDQLMSAITSGDFQKQQIAEQIIRQAAAMGGR